MTRVGWISHCLRAIPAITLTIASIASGQTAATGNAPPQNVDDALHQMSDKAGVIFEGQVLSIRKQAGEGAASGVVEVEFRVDQAIRGCTAGTLYTLREWAGLWAGGAQRYRVGQRLLMFLHTPGAAGLSSPIGGLDGAIPIHGASSPLVASGSSVQYPVADLRWVGAELLRPVSYRTEAVHSDHRSGISIPFIQAKPMVRASASSVESADIVTARIPAANDENTASIHAQQVAVQTVIGMLRSWQKANDAVR